MASLTLPSFENKRYPLPPGVVDEQRCSSKCWADGVGRDSIIIEITRFAIRGHILAEKCVLTRDWWDATQNFDLGEV